MVPSALTIAYPERVTNEWCMYVSIYFKEERTTKEEEGFIPTSYRDSGKLAYSKM
jgi:hypothetical protein